MAQHVGQAIFGAMFALWAVADTLERVAPRWTAELRRRYVR